MPIVKRIWDNYCGDSVAAMVGEPLKADDWKIDIVLGGSQKYFSVPPGFNNVVN